MLIIFKNALKVVTPNIPVDIPAYIVYIQMGL